MSDGHAPLSSGATCGVTDSFRPALVGICAACGEPSNPEAPVACGEPSNPEAPVACGEPSNPEAPVACGEPSNPEAPVACGEPSTTSSPPSDSVTGGAVGTGAEVHPVVTARAPTPISMAMTRPAQLGRRCDEDSGFMLLGDANSLPGLIRCLGTSFTFMVAPQIPAGARFLRAGRRRSLRAPTTNRMGAVIGPSRLWQSRRVGVGHVPRPARLFHPWTRVAVEHSLHSCAASRSLARCTDPHGFHVPKGAPL